LLFSLSFFPVLEGLMAGNFSAISLLIFTGVFLALKKDYDFLAGLLLGIQLIKPQLVLALIVILAYKRRWRALLGVGTVAIAWLGLAPRTCVGWAANAASAGWTAVTPGIITFPSDSRCARAAPHAAQWVASGVAAAEHQGQVRSAPGSTFSVMADQHTQPV